MSAIPNRQLEDDVRNLTNELAQVLNGLETRIRIVLIPGIVDPAGELPGMLHHFWNNAQDPTDYYFYNLILVYRIFQRGPRFHAMARAGFVKLFTDENYHFGPTEDMFRELVPPVEDAEIHTLGYLRRVMDRLDRPELEPGVVEILQRHGYYGGFLMVRGEYGAFRPVPNPFVSFLEREGHYPHVFSDYLDDGLIEDFMLRPEYPPQPWETGSDSQQGQDMDVQQQGQDMDVQQQ